MNHSDALTIILMGIQGSGKGTQARLLQEKYRFQIIEAGALLRLNAKEKTKTGEQIKQILDTGGIVPDEITGAIIQKEFEKLKLEVNLILDAFPRTLGQAELLQKILQNTKRNNVKVVVVSISDKEAIKRLSTRKVCSQCGKIFANTNLVSCDICNTSLEIRSDSTDEATRNRLAWHHEKVEPVIEMYRNTMDFYEINGEQTVEQVFQDIIDALHLDD